jgi:menaquinone-dependent protoporphyrinogen IX oxidase
VGTDADPPASRPLLVVAHTRTGSTGQLAAAAADAARRHSALAVDVRDAFDAGPTDVLGARAVLLATPARFGYMSGALKDFLERVYHPCLDTTAGLPYALLVKGDTDVDGAVASVERIVTGMRWRQVLPPVRVVGPVTSATLASAAELGATLAAGLEAGVF